MNKREVLIYIFNIKLKKKILVIDGFFRRGDIRRVILVQKLLYRFR